MILFDGNFKETMTKVYLVTFKIPHLYLKERQVPEDLDVVRIPPESVSVAFYSLVILLIRPLQLEERNLDFVNDSFTSRITFMIIKIINFMSM